MRQIPLDILQNLEGIIRSNPVKRDRRFTHRYSPDQGITTFLIRDCSDDIEVFVDTECRDKLLNDQDRDIPDERTAVISTYTGHAVGSRQAIAYAELNAEMLYANAE